MKGAAQRWIVAHLVGLSFVAAAGVARGADSDVTDRDRVYKNFTRETATVSENEIRLEVRGLLEENESNTRLNLLGFPVHGVDSLSGGIIELVGSYGFAKNAELGFIVPGFIQSLQFSDGSKSLNNQDVGDLLLYGKFQKSVAEHCSVGGGLELTTPNGPKNKGFSTGNLGVNPFVSTRYQQGRFGVGVNVGYNFYQGSTPDVFNYGAEVFLRGNSSFALRTEIIGRVFDQGGRFHDLTILPGIDFNATDNITIRPTGLANGTDTAMDWGIGLGIAINFPAPSLAWAAEAPVAAAPPPPPPPPPPAPPAKKKIVLRGVHFDFDKATIRDDAKPILDQAVETLKGNQDISVKVVGYTDSIGTEEYNQGLSLRRATAVRDYLAEHGIAASRLTVEGMGESNPVASNDTEDGRAQNRRVELLVAP